VSPTRSSPPSGSPTDGSCPSRPVCGSGQITLLGPNRAEYGGPSLIVTLARFPGPNFFWLCS
jgi:hypothetical protein